MLQSRCQSSSSEQCSDWAATALQEDTWWGLYAEKSMRTWQRSCAYMQGLHSIAHVRNPVLFPGFSTLFCTVISDSMHDLQLFDQRSIANRCHTMHTC